MIVEDVIGGALVGLGIATFVVWPMATPEEAFTGGVVSGLFLAAGAFALGWWS